MGAFVVQTILFGLVLSYVASTPITFHDDTENTNQSNMYIYNDKVEKFSSELVHHIAKSMNKGVNLIVAPITVWTILSVIAEGAAGNTQSEILNALKLSNNTSETRNYFKNLVRSLPAGTNTSTLTRLNAVFVDNKNPLLQDFRMIAKDYYDLNMISLNLSDVDNTFATKINQGISEFTHGKISKLVDNSFSPDTGAILLSVLYFEGSWSGPFLKILTSKKPFFDGFENMIGEVNMMYRRDVFPVITVNELQARVLELEYDVKNLSMLFLLPDSNVVLDNLFLKLKEVSLDKILRDLRSSVENEDSSGTDVDLFVPRFKIESDVILTEILKKNFGIKDLFDDSLANLTHMSKRPLCVKKIVHKAVIEVTEDGTIASGGTYAELTDKIFSLTRFELNRPFAYLIVEKTTSSIVFGGIYNIPSLF